MTNKDDEYDFLFKGTSQLMSAGAHGVEGNWCISLEESMFSGGSAMRNCSVEVWLCSLLMGGESRRKEGRGGGGMERGRR